jgi:ATP-dependent DNA helicase RecQ
LLYQPTDLEELSNQSAIRFPAIEIIRNIYQAVANYLQLPAGTGEGNYYDFDIADFVKKFNLPLNEVINVLKVLAQEGFMSFNEQVFMPVRVQFICNKEILYQFENEHPETEPLIKILLRSYEGIFDMPVAVYEKQIVGWLKSDIAPVQQLLSMLHSYHIIHYEPQKDTPQLYLLQPRVRARDVNINPVNYKQRKKQFEQRADAFINYTKNIKDCRSVISGNYFGDENMKPCGICDNCIQLKKNITADNFVIIKQQIETALSNGPLAPNDLMHQLKNISKEKAWQVIEFLRAENKIEVNKDGLIKANRL